MKGWGPKSSVCPSKPRETKLFGGISRDFAGISRDFAGISRWCPKSLRKKRFVFNSRRLFRGQRNNEHFNITPPENKFMCLVSHYSALGDTISCDAPYSAIGFRGKLSSAIPPLLGLSLDCNRPFLRKEVGV